MRNETSLDTLCGALAYTMGIEAPRLRTGAINTLVGFAMDHGCSYTSMGKGMHGKDLDADINIVHRYKAYPAE